jgi:hypothetical protein
MENTEKKITEKIETDETEVVENTLVLKKPVEINGEMVNEIKYDLESLTGNDVSDAIKMLAKHNTVVVMTETDQNYHAAIFAIASDLDYADIKRLSIKDYNKACNIVRDFFLEE